MWLDYPIDRSSHEYATPTSGGLGLVVFVSVTFVWALKGLDGGAVPLVLGGLAIAIIGLVDDLRSLPIAPRLFVQAIGMAAAIYSIGPVERIDLGGMAIELAPLTLAIIWIAGIWFINLYNFMDGIDGIASAEAAFIGLLAGALALPLAPEIATAWLIVGGAACGLLVWSWPPARIFMGDVGSGFLGFIIASLLVLSLQRGVFSLSTVLVLVSPFLCDTTITLLRRMLRGEAWYLGHRLHAYQHLARRWSGHRRVTIASIFLNVFLVAPSAWLCVTEAEIAPWVACCVLGVSAVIVLAAGAGHPESR